MLVTQTDKKMKCCISVIIPVYNAEKYIKRCLESLLSQTFKCFEIIIINDGSNDNSGSICDYYADIDKRVHVYHKKNGGVSAARQQGLNLCKGEYVIHVDADDWVAPNFLESLYSKAIISQADITICDYIEVFPHKENYKSQKPTNTSAQHFVIDLCTTLHGSCCNKLIKHEVISANHITFPSGINLKEDKLFNLHVALCSLKVAHVPQGLYYYTIFQLEKTASQKSSIASSIRSYNYGNSLFSLFINKNNSSSKLQVAQRRFSYPTLAYLIIYDKHHINFIKKELSRLSPIYILEIYQIYQISILYRLTLILSTLFPLRLVRSLITFYKWLVRNPSYQ